MKSAWMAGTPWCSSGPEREVGPLDKATASGEFSAFFIGSVGPELMLMCRGEVLEDPVSCGFAVIAPVEANPFSQP